MRKERPITDALIGCDCLPYYRWSVVVCYGRSTRIASQNNYFFGLSWACAIRVWQSALTYIWERFPPLNNLHDYWAQLTVFLSWYVILYARTIPQLTYVARPWEIKKERTIHEKRTFSTLYISVVRGEQQKIGSACIPFYFCIIRPKRHVRVEEFVESSSLYCSIIIGQKTENQRGVYLCNTRNIFFFT